MEKECKYQQAIKGDLRQAKKCNIITECNEKNINISKPRVSFHDRKLMKIDH